MSFKPLARLNERSYTDPDERLAFVIGYGDGFNCIEFGGEGDTLANWPNAYAAGFWTGTDDMEVKRR